MKIHVHEQNRVGMKIHVHEQNWKAEDDRESQK